MELHHPSHKTTDLQSAPLLSTVYSPILEIRVRFELTCNCVADSSLAAWVPNHLVEDAALVVSPYFNRCALFQA